MVRRLSFLAAATLVTFSYSLHLQAAEVAKVKDKKVLINLEPSDDFKVDDTAYAIDGNGKRKGIVRFVKIKNNKAIAEVRRGRAEVGWLVEPRQTPAAKHAHKETHKEEATPIGPEQRSYWGGMLGYTLDTMKVDVSSGRSTSMSGSGYSAKAVADYAVLDQVWFRGTGGLEMFNTSSSDRFCGTGGAQACGTKLGYIALDFWGRYLFSLSDFRPWAGGGFSLLFPMSKDTTAVEDSSVTNTSTMSFGAGFDYFLSGGSYIPVQFEYSLFPDSNEVKAHFFAIRVGYMFPF